MRGWWVLFQWFWFRVTGIGEGSLQSPGTAFAMPWCANPELALNLGGFGQGLEKPYPK
ncbi:hypothetical protein [Pseudomonas mucidolens]|uniref:hypothetical protein n=1 Tax=Pseudomonas mucidolens TaxID=46679 RepID=UPI0030D8285E